MKQRIDNDLMINADRTKVARRTVKLFDNIQLKSDKETTLLAVAAAFLLMVRALGVKAQDVFSAATNLMSDSLHPDAIEHRFAAMLMHLEDDIISEVR
jgi:hypothetical protein